MGPAPNERRSARRYPVDLKFACRLLTEGVSVYIGSGTTCNMSSKGLLVQLDQPLNKGDLVELLVRWPAGRQIMHVLGHVVRSDAAGTAMEIVQHKFAERTTAPAARTRSRSRTQGSS